MRVRGTRIPIDTIVRAFNEGATAEEIAEQYDTLRLADIYAVIGYYLRHRAEVDAYIKRNEQTAHETRQEMESRFPPQGLRESLLKRRKHHPCLGGGGRTPSAHS